MFAPFVFSPVSYVQVHIHDGLIQTIRWNMCIFLLIRLLNLKLLHRFTTRFSSFSYFLNILEVATWKIIKSQYAAVGYRNRFAHVTLAKTMVPWKFNLFTWQFLYKEWRVIIYSCRNIVSIILSYIAVTRFNHF